MKTIAKYNLFKGVSTGLTMGTPIVTLACCSELFVHKSETAISAAGVFAILFAALFFKDKLLENLKMPSPFVISVIGLIVIMMIESIIAPLKIVFISTMVTTGVDTVTFRRIYKSMELDFPESAEKFKHFGFIFGKTENIIGE